MRANPYDELPYKSLPIEWTAPERLAVASLLHGGPRAPVETYRVLDLGCGNGANVIRLAYYRRQAAFVGVDGAASQIELANVWKSALDLSNIEFTTRISALPQLVWEGVCQRGHEKWLSDTMGQTGGADGVGR